ncbi:hypothetical protein D3C75_987290 [compost metagenome]
MHDRVGDELQLVAEALRAPPANLFSCRRDRCHTGAHHFEHVLLRFSILDEPSTSQCDERTGRSETAIRFCGLIFTFHSGLTLLEQIEEICGLIVVE